MKVSRRWCAALCIASLVMAGCNSNSGSGATPIVAVAGQWSWVDFPDAFCGDGSATGVGINPSPTHGTRVLIFLESGGSCDSLQTCYTQGTAVHFTTGYHASDFSSDVADVSSEVGSPGGPFNRSSSTNPFKDDNYVFVPYCTGDVYAGNHLMSYDATHVGHHVGYADMTAYLARIAATFPDASRVVLAGSSAGGFGALINWAQAQQAFGSVRVDMLDDSGVLMPPDIESPGTPARQALQTQEAAWGVPANLPSDCSACAANPDALWDYYQARFPSHRAGLLSYVNDSVVPTYEQVTPTQFATGLAEVETDLAGNASQRYFVVNATGHVLLFSPGTAQGSTTVEDWLTQFATDSSAWSNVH